MPLDALHTLPGAIVACAAVLVALGVIGKYLRQWFRWFAELGAMVREIRALTRSELEHNHGSSMKDDVHGIAVAVGLLQRQAAELGRRQKHDYYVLRALIDKYHPEPDAPPTHEEK